MFCAKATAKEGNLLKLLHRKAYSGQGTSTSCVASLDGNGYVLRHVF